MAEKYKIEKGVPVPKRSAGGTPKYNFREMEVGDSFKFSKSEYSKVARAAHKWGATNGRSFMVRTLTDKEGGECRCWRIR